MRISGEQSCNAIVIGRQIVTILADYDDRVVDLMALDTFHQQLRVRAGREPNYISARVVVRDGQVPSHYDSVRLSMSIDPFRSQNIGRHAIRLRVEIYIRARQRELRSQANESQRDDACYRETLQNAEWIDP